MNDKVQKEHESFSPEDRQVKTYSLVELVKAPATMVERGPDDTIFSFPIIAVLELLLTLGVLLVLLVVSLGLDAPLEEIANPNITTDPAKAPWYFMGLQEMLEHGHPTVMAVLLPTTMLVFVLILPYLDNSPDKAGIWFTSQRGRRITGYTALYVVVVMSLYIFLDSQFPLREILRGVLHDTVLTVVFPFLFLLVFNLLPVLVLLRYKPDNREIVMVIFTVLFTSALVFTLAGFFFRGPGFELYWPWNMPGDYRPWHNL